MYALKLLLDCDYTLRIVTFMDITPLDNTLGDFDFFALSSVSDFGESIFSSFNDVPGFQNFFSNSPFFFFAAFNILEGIVCVMIK